MRSEICGASSADTFRRTLCQTQNYGRRVTDCEFMAYQQLRVTSTMMQQTQRDYMTDRTINTTQYTAWNTVHFQLGSKGDNNSISLLQTSVTSYHGSATSVVTIRCRKSCNKKQGMVVIAQEARVNHGRPGESMTSLLRIVDDRNRWATVTMQASVGVTQLNYKPLKISFTSRLAD